MLDVILAISHVNNRRIKQNTYRRRLITIHIAKQITRS